MKVSRSVGIIQFVILGAFNNQIALKSNNVFPLKIYGNLSFLSKLIKTIYSFI